MLQRDGESSYYINNTQVRRRDIHDIFLGTGLGPRAYAIIEQGMISRVIEAKPEELRIFLEEAAGVSKYKERRRETEHRLADTRENLARVEDIRLELGPRSRSSTRQAEVAPRSTRRCRARPRIKQSLLWWLRQARRRERGPSARRARSTGSRTSSRPRPRGSAEIERRLEQARADHYAAGDAVNAAQGALYEINTEVSRLEAELRFMTETRAAPRGEPEHPRRAHRAVAAQPRRARRRGRHVAGPSRRRRRERIAAAQSHLAAQEARAPGLEEAHRTAQDRLAAARDAIAATEQTFRLEQAQVAHAGRTLDGLRCAGERLEAERGELAEPDSARLESIARGIVETESEAAACAGRIRDLQQDLPVLEAARAAALARLQELEREANTRAGRHATLRADPGAGGGGHRDRRLARAARAGGRCRGCGR